ncbi:MAG: hypothetical protein ACE5D7_10520 [Fidelibacterota bacterium]
MFYDFYYDNANRLTAATYPSTSTMGPVYEYDNASRLTKIRNRKSNTSSEDYIYYYDDASNITKYYNSEFAWNDYWYEYDNTNQLTHANYYIYNNPNLELIEGKYYYDSVGNRTYLEEDLIASMIQRKYRYHYDSCNRLTSEDYKPSSSLPWELNAKTYNYDSEGNLTKEVCTSGFLCDYNQKQFTRDYDGRINALTLTVT